MSKTDYEVVGYTKFESYLDVGFIDEVNKIIDNMLVDIEINDGVFDEDNTGKIKQIQYLHNKNDIFIKLLDKIKPAIEHLLDGKKYNILNVQLFEKHPQISKPTRAHQDNAYYKQTPATPLTIWIALDDIDEENGCLYYAPYSHIKWLFVLCTLFTYYSYS